MSAITMEQYETLLHSVLEHIYPGQWEAFIPGFITWVSDGTFGAVFGGYGGEDGTAVRIGMGILSDLSLDEELLSEVAQMNKTCGAGHFWVNQGSNDRWQLFWGHSMQRQYLEGQFAADFLVQMARALPLMYEAFTEHFQDKFGGKLWWQNNPGDEGAQALILVSHTM